MKKNIKKELAVAIAEQIAYFKVGNLFFCIKESKNPKLGLVNITSKKY